MERCSRLRALARCAPVTEGVDMQLRRVIRKDTTIIHSKPYDFIIEASPNTLHSAVVSRKSSEYEVIQFRNSDGEEWIDLPTIVETTSNVDNESYLEYVEEFKKRIITN